MSLCIQYLCPGRTAWTFCILCLSLHAFKLQAQTEMEYPLLEVLETTGQPHQYRVTLYNQGQSPAQFRWPKHAQVDKDPVNDTPCEPYSRGSNTLAANHCTSALITPPEVSASWQRFDTSTGQPSVLHQLKGEDWLVDSQAHLLVELRLPPNYVVSSPWAEQITEAGHVRFPVPSSPYNSDGLLLFGEFTQATLLINGMSVDLAYLGGNNLTAVEGWLRDNLRQNITTFGAVARPDLQVIVVPVAGHHSESPVPFGHVIRAGNNSIRFFVANNASYAELMADWTATHEFSHLLLPYLGYDGKWVSEGFASYYQNVLMAQEGQYSAEQAWQNLLAGFARAIQVRPLTSPNNSVELGMRQARMMIYWSGAALALMADVEIRQQTKGERTLANLLGEFAECCFDQQPTWNTTNYLQALDKHLAQPVLMPLYNRYADRPGLPDVANTLRALGISHRDFQSVTLVKGPLDALRDTIMGPPQSNQTPGQPPASSTNRPD
ncbi:hypothetical protein [Halioxenophilus sp. WMMB6]|uniref:hypothetical protein n=1 Tax=Halioxenophilus sp. WMMB6 TaxID=3073815 RepID=UPI00295E2EBB|nr:hypothetical protein [Halioxenophilus sp. WMMB6]